jgi:hypothetical protein
VRFLPLLLPLLVDLLGHAQCRRQGELAPKDSSESEDKVGQVKLVTSFPAILDHKLKVNAAVVEEI